MLKRFYRTRTTIGNFSSYTLLISIFQTTANALNSWFFDLINFVPAKFNRRICMQIYDKKDSVYKI
ncbi:hypothetical protein CSUNSWCD_774 [Campylobacter showae CSUNSWCD]|uniref:Uncharacterized protein n=1 Tax=Campylobacter showae CSUNSWCD TaxID=1244083 RepID=M5IQA2_9BACT|nr:hypothetical protein CSUNSWCD_774 [Campylobacter showae CSUNSWCD]